MKKFLSWLALLFGLIYFFVETWYHLSYNQSCLALTADYISVFLLIFSGVVNLRSKQAFGLLCGAWGYTSCIMYRAFIWRIESQYLEAHEESIVKILVIAIIISFSAFIISFIKSMPKKK